MLGNRALPIQLLSFNTASCDGTYKVLTAGLTEPCSELRFANNSDKVVSVSFDGGITDNMVVLAGEAFPVIFQDFAIPASGISKIGKYTKISIKSAAGTGLFYVSGWYQS